MSDTKFGIFGGQSIPETLMNAVLEGHNAYKLLSTVPGT